MNLCACVRAAMSPQYDKTEQTVPKKAPHLGEGRVPSLFLYLRLGFCLKTPGHMGQQEA